MKKLVTMACLAFCFCSCIEDCDIQTDKEAIKRITIEIRSLEVERNNAEEINKPFYDRKIDEKEKEMDNAVGNCK